MTRFRIFLIVAGVAVASVVGISLAWTAIGGGPMPIHGLVPAAGGQSEQGDGQQGGAHRGLLQSLVRSDHSSGKQRRCRVSVR